jgi:hypothetical protein
MERATGDLQNMSDGHKATVYELTASLTRTTEREEGLRVESALLQVRIDDANTLYQTLLQSSATDRAETTEKIRGLQLQLEHARATLAAASVEGSVDTRGETHRVCACMTRMIA